MFLINELITMSQRSTVPNVRYQTFSDLHYLFSCYSAPSKVGQRFIY
jgi:hypothetical protein